MSLTSNKRKKTGSRFKLATISQSSIAGSEKSSEDNNDIKMASDNELIESKTALNIKEIIEK